MKKVSTRAVINERSSHPKSMKRNVLVNEALRILRNCNQYLKWEETAGHLSYLMKRLQFSGYDQIFRHDVVKTALKRYDDNKQGSNQMTERTQTRRNKEKRKYGTDTVMFVPSTQNEELKKEIQRCADKHKIKIKVQEKVDNSVRRELQRSNPFKAKECGRESCLVCERGSGIDCRTRGCNLRNTVRKLQT